MIKIIEIYLDGDGVPVLKTGMVYDYVWDEEMDIMLFIIGGNKYECLRTNYTEYD